MKNSLGNTKRGFTLVEVITVLLILAILAALMIPSLIQYIDKAKGMSALANARQASLASSAGLTEWVAAGSKGKSDTAYKINIEQEIIELLDLGPMDSFTATNNSENVVQVGLNLPSYYSQGWDQFIKDCKAGTFKNFVRVWIGKKPDRTPGNTIKAIYYVSADGEYASRIVYDGATKLGATDQKTGSHYEKIER